MYAKYKLLSNNYGHLPLFVPGTIDLVALLRPNTPLACARPRVAVQLENQNLMGEVCAQMFLGPFDYHVVTQPGNQFTVAAVDLIDFGGVPVTQSHAAFQLGPAVQVTPDRPIASVVSAFWSLRGETVEVRQLQRIRNALVLGKIAPSVSPDTWLETDNARFLAAPGSYVIQEFSGRGVRVVPPTYMGREFESLRTPYGEVIEEFMQTDG